MTDTDTILMGILCMMLIGCCWIGGALIDIRNELRKIAGEK